MRMRSIDTDAQFVYNENGLRIQKTVNGVATKYTLHGKNVVHMTSGTDELHIFYDAQNRPAVVVYNGVPYAYVKSLQGDIVAILDENGNTVVSYGYDAWGAPLWCTGELAETLGKVQPFRYRGYVFDEETGLYYLRSRYYNPNCGKFINADAIISGNLFAYCYNSPVKRVDTCGRESSESPTSNSDVLPDYTELIFSVITSNLPSFKEHIVGTGLLPTFREIFIQRENYFWFAEQVTLKGPWDVKQPDSWKLQFGEAKMPTANEQVLFMGETVDAADIGNFTYGFFGASMGIAPKLLYIMGGVTDKLFADAQAPISMKRLNAALNNAMNDPNGWYGDKEEDYKWVKKGVECYYDRFHTAW